MTMMTITESVYPCGRVGRVGRLTLVVAVALSTSSVIADEPTGWLQWRGPSRDGFVAGPAWPDGLASERLEQIWQVEDLGPSYSGPLLTENLVLITETRDEATEHVIAYDRATGEKRWEASWEGAMSVPFFAASNGSWIRATPCVDEGRLYVAGMCDVLVCFDLGDGSELWRVDFTKAFDSPPPAFGFVSSPLVRGDHVYVQAGSGFVKLDKKTGEVVWRVLDDAGGMNGSAFSSPFIATLNGVEQILVQTRENLAGVNPDDGSVLWQTPVEAFRGMNIVTPTVIDGRVFTTTYGGGSFLFSVASGEAEKPVDLVWRNKVQGYMSTPIIIDGHAYVHLRNQRFACLNLTTGEEDWITQPFGKYWSMVAQGDRILALDETGDLRLIKGTPDGFKLLGEAKVSDLESWAHLAIDGDVIAIRDLDRITLWRWK
jgi:outer membrane protein assembly factor BamB